MLLHFAYSWVLPLGSLQAGFFAVGLSCERSVMADDRFYATCSVRMAELYALLEELCSRVDHVASSGVVKIKGPNPVGCAGLSGHVVFVGSAFTVVVQQAVGIADHLLH